MLTRLGQALRIRASARRPYTNVYGLGRTLLALGTLGTLTFSNTFDLFRPAVGIASFPNCFAMGRGGLFCVAGREHLEIAHWIAIAVLLVAASGWRPRFFGVLHWYVAWSLFTSGLMVDGGDQITAVLTLLLIPVTLTDARRWHWEAPREPAGAPGTGLLPTGAAAAQLIALSTLFMIRLQMAGVYFHAAVAKMGVPEWRDGTAVYYWFTDPWFGLSEPVKSWVLPLLANGVVVAAATWGAMALELFLFTGLVAERRHRRVLLCLGIAFHAMIALVHGLPSFSLAMWAGLVLYLHPVDEEFAALRVWSGRWLDAARAHLRLPRSWRARATPMILRHGHVETSASE
jgi:antimicrobial peptide system SdpB family protein